LSCTLVLHLDFTWTAPDTCPTQAQVVEELSRAVDAGGKELPPLAARAVVERDGATWRLELSTEMDGVLGTRQLQADSCEGLARAATLVLALTLGEGLARRQEAEAKAKAAPPPAKPPPPPPPKSTPPAPPRESHALLWAAVTLGSDPLRSVGPGLTLGAAFEPSLLRFGIVASATAPRSTPFVGSGGDLRSYTFGGALEACLAPASPPFRFAACANGSRTLFEVSGRGTARDGQASVPLYGLGPSLAAEWVLSKNAFLRLALVSRFFLVRPELVVEDLPQRRRVAVAQANGELGAGVRW
jgi:hypothetical protein